MSEYKTGIAICIPVWDNELELAVMRPDPAMYLNVALGKMVPGMTYTLNYLTEKMSYCEARTTLVKKAIQQQAQYIFFMDYDIIIPDFTFLSLFNHQKNIVTGIYFTKSNPSFPVIFQGKGLGPYLNWKKNNPPLLKIHSAGLGCCLIHSRVFEILPEPWFEGGRLTKEPGIETRTITSEDINFFDKANVAGIDVFADTKVICDHMDIKGNVYPDHITYNKYCIEEKEND